MAGLRQPVDHDRVAGVGLQSGLVDRDGLRRAPRGDQPGAQPVRGDRVARRRVEDRAVHLQRLGVRQHACEMLRARPEPNEILTHTKGVPRRHDRYTGASFGLRLIPLPPPRRRRPPAPAPSPPPRPRAATSAAARRRRRRQPGLGLARRERLLERRPEVEVRRRRRARSRWRSRSASVASSSTVPSSPQHDAVAAPRLLARHEAEGDVARDRLDRPVEAVLPAAAARRAVDEHVAGRDLDLVALGRQHLLGAVGAAQELRRALARLAAEHAPRPREPAVVVDRDLARLEVDVALLDPVAAAVQAGAAGVGDRRVAVDPQRIVGLEVLGRDVLEQRPPRVAVHPVADRPAGDAAVEDLHRVEELRRPRPSRCRACTARCRSPRPC